MKTRKRRTTEEVLRESEDKYRRLFESAMDMIHIVDEKFRIIDINETELRKLGYSRSEIIGKPLLNIIHPDFRQTTKEILPKLDSGHTITSYETALQTKNGETVFVEVNAVPIMVQGRFCGVQAILYDISEHKRRKEALKKAKETAETANIAKSQFLANMSHEIRTPLNGVIGMAGILMEMGLSEEQLDCVETIRSCSDDLLSLVNDILDFEKLEVGKLEIENISFDLLTASDQVADALSVQTDKKNIELILRYVPGTPRYVLGDPSRFRQVLTNLVTNAIKFTSSGYVLITIERIQSNGNSLFNFSVVDTGIGILENQIESLFDEFTQADTSTTRKYGGTGIGLAICKRLVELMSGEIFAENRKEGGSHFWFTLPFKVDKHTLTEPLSIKSIQDVRVLIVDDSKINRKILHEQITSRGIVLAEKTCCEMRV